MKEQYTAPEVELIVLENEDIILNSGGDKWETPIVRGNALIDDGM